MTSPNPGKEARLGRLLENMLAPDPADRPSAQEVEEILAAWGEGQPESINPPTVAAPPLILESHSAPGGREAGVAPASEEEIAPGRQLGRYWLREKLGQGGMGAVYKAEDLADGKPVAIKVFRSAWAARPEARRRLHKEARLLAEVNNPFVTNLLAIHEDEGVPYLVLEYVQGHSLAKLLESRGRLEERLALGIMADVARALVEAHERGLVHRDIKPENILVLDPEGTEKGQGVDTPRSPGEVRVKLSDFGLARHVQESESLHLTATGMILGTPLYMAPEQGMGSPVDPRTDVYAMGATLFHLLAGRPPFLASTPLGLIAQHCHEPAPPLRQFNPAASDAVCQVTARALAKEPDRRYPHAAALLRDLERLLRGEPAGMAAHPRLPVRDPRDVIAYDFVWDLEATGR